LPLYEYACQKCGRHHERLETFKGPHLRKCPSCGGKVEQLISAPALQFKGTGWYVTDYAGKSGGGESSKGEGGDSAKGDGAKESGGEKDSKQSTESKESKDTKESASSKESKESKKSKSESKQSKEK
jgi:putative FmdB family regulatory protein